MATLDELIKIRKCKLEAVKKAGFSPYPVKSRRTHTVREALADFSSLEKKKKEIFLAGAIRSMRSHGGSTFLDLVDGTGKIQAYLKKDGLGENIYQFFLDNFDIGDYLQLRGVMFATKRGEKTLEVSDYKMLAKSLRPLPEKWHGLTDVEERYRKRYLDLIFNAEVQKKFLLRSKIIKEIRDFLDKEGFLEVETPILQPRYGGARAKPFRTHLNALDMDLYMRISPELYLKRLLVGGLEKVYEIGKCFRNEGVDRFHNPDFTMLEFYWAYQDHKELMKFTEKLFSSFLKKALGIMEVQYQGQKMDFTPPWPRLEFSQLLRKYAKISLDEISEQAIKKEAQKMGVDFPKEADKAVVADEIYKKYCRPKLWQPVFIIHHPLGFQPLAKASEESPQKLANFQLVAGGVELVNAFSELNDPLEQRRRFEEQEKLYKSGLEEAQRIDEDYLEALEHGMPPAAGFGMGIDRLVVLLTDSYSLREVILFPTMRPR